MKLDTWLTACITSVTLCHATHALTPISGHIDVEFDYLGADQWLGQLFGGASNGDPNERAVPSDSAFIVVPNIDWQDGPENEGARFARPPGAQWDFTGVDSGDPLWILTQSDNSIAWPGFENNHGEGIVASFSSSDPRVGSTPRPWIPIHLNDVRYIGRGAGHFALWQAAFGSQTVWASTADGGITEDDVFFSLENGHDHANWGFSDLGVYIVELSARAYLASGMSLPTQSDPMPVVFAVGNYAFWQASQFDLDMLESTELSGDFADPDKDGVVNLLEYALNTSPLVADRSPMEAGTGTRGTPAVFVEGDRLAIEFVRRRAETSPEIHYLPVFSNSLGGAQLWQESGTTTVTPIDNVWERVKSLDTVPLSAAHARFARLEIEWLGNE